MKISFDPAKNERNIRERGIPFEKASEFDFKTAILTQDTRKNYGEVRFRALGSIEGELHALAFTLRDGTMRVISLRRASRKERNRYAKARS